MNLEFKPGDRAVGLYTGRQYVILGRCVTFPTMYRATDVEDPAVERLLAVHQIRKWTVEDGEWKQ